MLTQERIETIAQCFANTNFMNKSLALRNAGYSPKYAKGIGQKLLDNIRVKEEIDKIKAELSQKHEITEEFIIKGIKTKAQSKNEGIALRALVELGHIKGLYELDNSQKQPQAANITLINTENEVDKRELELIQKMKKLGPAICEG